MARQAVIDGAIAQKSAAEDIAKIKGYTAEIFDSMKNK